MTYSILLTVKRPDESNRLLYGEYENFVNILLELKKQKKDLRLLTESCVLLPLDKSLHGLSTVLRYLRELPYTYTILPGDNEWLEGTNKD